MDPPDGKYAIHEAAREGKSRSDIQLFKTRCLTKYVAAVVESLLNVPCPHLHGALAGTLTLL